MVERSIRIALSADGHSGGSSEGHPTVTQWKEAAREARRQGVQVLAHIGDWSHHGLPSEAGILGQALVEGFLGETDEEREESVALGRVIIGTLGNHDGLQGFEQQIASTLRDHGITLLENQTAFFDFANGGRLGVVGLDGSLTRERFTSIEQLDRSERMVALHQATEEQYWEGFDRSMDELEAADVDARIVLTHIPVFPEQYSDSVDHEESYDISPQFRRRVSLSPQIDFVASGHIHSLRANPMWRRVQARGVSREGVVFYNVAGQTRLQEGQPLMEIVDLPLRRSAR